MYCYHYQRLRDLRQDHDLAQKEVAALLGIDQRVYSTYETGKREIPIHHLETLASHYRTSVDFLLGRTDVTAPYPASQNSSK